ncbi:hypothetical protein EYF80_049102 [Liparis tanakae]|uniref:Uncharacterized protein n=1 Tax=Liparis tanakae TaxID=230148 RepID=A0A4Z2FKC4_9TELE|nr:hypothetical protein EYF80_049102 [Liparis tanakae]
MEKSPIVLDEGQQKVDGLKWGQNEVLTSQAGGREIKRTASSGEDGGIGEAMAHSICGAEQLTGQSLGANITITTATSPWTGFTK